MSWTLILRWLSDENVHELSSNLCSLGGSQILQLHFCKVSENLNDSQVKCKGNYYIESNKVKLWLFKTCCKVSSLCPSFHFLMPWRYPEPYLSSRRSILKRWVAIDWFISYWCWQRYLKPSWSLSTSLRVTSCSLCSSMVSGVLCPLSWQYLSLSSEWFILLMLESQSLDDFWIHLCTTSTKLYI